MKVERSSHEVKVQYWRKQISNWKASGLSQKQYCERSTLVLSTFGYWKRKINNPEPTTPKFFPLTITDSSKTPSDASLLLQVGKNRFQVETKEDFSPTTLKKLIATLEQL